MARQHRNALTFIVAAALLAACSSAPPARPTASQSSPVPSQNPVTSSALPTVPDPDCCWFSTSPAPIGKAVPLAGGTLAVGVIGVTRPANEIVLAASPANAAPAPEFEYLLVNVSLQCIASDCEPSLWVLFSVIDSNGATYEEVTEPLVIPNSFRLSQKTEDVTAQGNIAFIVPITEKDLVLEFIWPNMTGVYLGLK